MKCLLSFTDIITLRASDVLAEEYNISACARASLAGYLGWYFEFACGKQNRGAGIRQLYVHRPAASASDGHDLRAVTVVVASQCKRSMYFSRGLRKPLC